MSEKEHYPPDKTPVFGLDELEAPLTDAQPTGREFPEENAGTDNAPPCISLHDKLSGVSLVTDTFPVEIGNGRRFDMALRGPGPDGLYARIESHNGVLTIERCNPQVFMAADTVEVSRYLLTGPTSLQLGDHLIAFDFDSAKGSVATPPRKRRRWLLLVAVVSLIIGALLIRLLLVADEAESRVSVVSPETQSSEPEVKRPPPLPDGERAQPDVDQTVTASSGERVPEPETAAVPSAISLFFMATPPSPITPAATASVPTSTPVRAPIKSPTKKPVEGAVNSPELVARYRRGELVSFEAARPELKDALSAIRSYYDSETLDQRLAAWEALSIAEQAMGLEGPSVRGEQIRESLGESLLQAARKKEQAEEDRQAYTLFSKALDLGQNSEEGRLLIITLDEEAARLYRFGYRLKYSDPSTARQYWVKVTNQVPTQSEWYQKASMALNDTKGIRG
ncbi:hypothetical protein LCGC14_0683910 [marine sediment metagenome]|uniref:Uncharacterized protein n=2 Tax=root TaxID=1 RepID=A0A831W2W8_9GAMM|nr:hypothetical protein [Marinobacter antarcticus]HEA53657.1 hypothetical protein [Marinobacter antarcticus]